MLSMSLVSIVYTCSVSLIFYPVHTNEQKPTLVDTSLAAGHVYDQTLLITIIHVFLLWPCCLGPNLKYTSDVAQIMKTFTVYYYIHTQTHDTKASDLGSG